jgi:micrococcal nuclease
MLQNTKLLILFSFFIITLGISFIFYGVDNFYKSSPSYSPTPIFTQSPSPVVTNQIIVPSTDSSAFFEGERAVVTKVVDGDTMEVLINGQSFNVRFVGIDTPETVDPRRPVGCFGKESSNETKRLLTGKNVILQKDISNTDKYNRILRYVYLPLDDGSFLFVNDYLVREGFANVYTYPPDVKYNEKFREAEKEARENKRGLWASCK